MSVKTDRLLRENQRAEASIGGTEDLPYLREGIRAGLVGASIVAIFFLLVDLAAGRPLATPNALGAALFLGERIDLSRALSGPLVLAYTAAHGTVFVGIAAIAATLLLGARRVTGGVLLVLATWLGVFAVCEVFFSSLAWLTDLSVWSALGAGRVAVANLVAAGGMTASLLQGLRRAASA